MAKSKGSNNKLPWLQSLWDGKKRETAKRVRAAVTHLAASGKPITLVAIREAVRDLFQVSMATNTIQRNEEAYAIYQEHAKPARNKARGLGRLAGVVQNATGPERIAVRARIARLRRHTKSDLIARLFESEARERDHAIRETNLREEVLRLSLPWRGKGAKP